MASLGYTYSLQQEEKNKIGKELDEMYDKIIENKVENFYHHNHSDTSEFCFIDFLKEHAILIVLIIILLALSWYNACKCIEKKVSQTQTGGMANDALTYRMNPQIEKQLYQKAGLPLPDFLK